MTDETPRRNSQVAAGKGKVQFVVTDAFREMLRHRAELLGTTMTDVMITAVEEFETRQARRDERRTARGT
jgi:hypothetical protein